MTVRLRLGGKPVASTNVLRWVDPARRRLTVAGSPDALSLGGVPLPITSPETSIPALEGELIWQQGEASGTVRLKPALEERPGEAYRECLTGLMRVLAAYPETRWGDLSERPIFFHQGLWRHLTPEEVDGAIDASIGAFFRIAEAPRIRLREEQAILPVDRVKRPAADADRTLVQMGRHLVGGLIPRATHLKARLFDEDLALYENRVVVTLATQLRGRAQGRLQRLELALESLDEIAAELLQLRKLGLHERAGRLRKASGVDQRLEDLQAKAATHRRQLLRQLDAFGAILEGVLGDRLQDAPPIQGHLRSTNILAFDERYAEIGTLWRTMRRYGGDRQAPDVVLDDLDRGYAAVVRLAVCKALKHLRFVGDAPVPLNAKAPPLQVARDDGWQVTLRPTPTGLIVEYRFIDAEAEQARRRSGRRPDPPQRVEFHATFDTAERRQVGGDAVWVHPVTGQASVADAADWLVRFATGQTPGRVDGGRPPAALPVAPWSFSSVHRVVRLLRGLLLGTAITAGRVPRRCPLCGGQSRASTSNAEDDRQCIGCGGQWGRRQCTHCETWIPKLLPKLPRIEADMSSLGGDGFASRQALLDTLVGPHGLSGLCQAPQEFGRMLMICPGCGRCGARRTRGCRRCGDVIEGTQGAQTERSAS